PDHALAPPGPEEAASGSSTGAERAAHRSRTPIHTMYAAPATRTRVDASEDAASSADTPTAAATPQTSVPALTPTAVAKACRLPFAIAARSTSAVSSPGTTVSRPATTAKPASAVPIVIRSSCHYSVAAGQTETPDDDAGRHERLDGEDRQQGAERAAAVGAGE